MKVTPPKPSAEPPPAPPANKTTTTRRPSSPTDTMPHEDDGALASTHGRDFASVLEDVTRADSRDDSEGNDPDERQDTKTSTQAERERESKRREDRHDGGTGGGSFEGRGQVRDAVAHGGEAAPARAILHIADLERIVAAVRTQLHPGGRHEVTLELQRSVLEGLRVRLTTDAQGRVNAEFIAATEKVRAQLDARAPELSALLRGRGVELASLHTTIGAHGNQTGSGDGGRHAAPDASGAPRAASVTDAAPATIAQAADDSPSEPVTDESTSLYRA